MAVLQSRQETNPSLEFTLTMPGERRHHTPRPHKCPKFRGAGHGERSGVAGGADEPGNILGLSLGLSCFGVILLSLAHEWSFDRFHVNGDRIFRVVQDWHYSTGEVQHHSLTSGRLAEDLRRDFPGIERVVRMHRTFTAQFMERGARGAGDILLSSALR